MALNVKEIWRTSMAQSAEDINCQRDDFLRDENVIVPMKPGKNARKYFREPILADFVSYGRNAVVSVVDDLRELASEYVVGYGG